MSSAKQLRDKIVAGDVKSVDAVKVVFDRIETIEPKVGAYLSLYKEQAMEQAEQVDAKGVGGCARCDQG
jgi:aspartyl-tRNA(Asn)/glutamyl-tRNA(Gln) amidotransferase subunit A